MNLSLEFQIFNSAICHYYLRVCEEEFKDFFFKSTVDEITLIHPYVNDDRH